ncbi:hypothetical protein RNJ44_03663 [Nakaseomyces bracarensis]|uniref:NEDD8-activating enzyme E1 regulatory subunit n=1 Tax=Nakaseomyces bracarensis TaxID=273131 RepID=A0ABR4NXJ2_9SACH
MVEIFDRYDRQLRLWGTYGQQLIENSHIITIIDNNSKDTHNLVYETWKNLILTGTKHLSLVNLSGQEFPLPMEDLKQLNDDVELTCTKILTEETYPTILLNIEEKLQHEIFRKSKFVVISCNVTGMVGHIQNYLPKMHLVFNSHNDHSVNDLRLKDPWPEYEYYLNSFNETLSDKYNASSVPYPVILYQILKKTDGSIKTKDIKEQLDGFYLSKINENAIYDLNFEQAKRFAYICNAHDKFIPDVIEPLLENVERNQNMTHEPEEEKYFVLLVALRKFLSDYQSIPFSGELPDLESSTENFNKLKMIYNNKFNVDHNIFRKYLSTLYQSSISTEESTSFLKNLSNICYLNFSTDMSAFNMLPAIQAEEFKDYWELYTTKKLPANIKTRKILSTNSYSSTKFFAGLVSQEMIKFITHQYIPIENVFLFNAFSNYSETIKL